MSEDQGFVIETGVEIPTITRESKYPWAEMGDGDSIFFAEEKAASAAQSARLWVKNNDSPLSVVTRTVDGGTRIWFVDTGEDEDGNEGEE